MQIISTMVLYNYKVPVIIKKIHILSWSITGKPSKYFPGLSRTYEQNSRTFQNRKKNPGLFQDVATLCLLTRLCYESHVRPLLDFRLGSYEPYRKFPTYFVGVFCSNLECKFPMYIDIVNFRYISEIYDIFCRLFLFQLRAYFVVYIYIENFRYISEIYNIICRLFLFQLRVYVVVYIRIYRTNFIVNKLKKAVLQNKKYFSKRHPIRVPILRKQIVPVCRKI